MQAGDALVCELLPLLSVSVAVSVAVSVSVCRSAGLLDPFPFLPVSLYRALSDCAVCVQSLSISLTAHSLGSRTKVCARSLSAHARCASLSLSVSLFLTLYGLLSTEERRTVFFKYTQHGTVRPHAPGTLSLSLSL